MDMRHPPRGPKGQREEFGSLAESMAGSLSFFQINPNSNL